MSNDDRAIERELVEHLQDIYEEFLPVHDGEVASYIPELATADPGSFAIAVAGVKGRTFEAGAAATSFTIQSISKPFVYGMALDDVGREGVLEHIGVEPSGEAFNAIELDEVSNRPYNPMINSGAIATTSLVRGDDGFHRRQRVLDTLSAYAGRPLQVDEATFLSEQSTGDRNRAIAYLMRSSGMLDQDIDETLALYFHQCSVEVTARDLAMMAATLANGGIHPQTGIEVLSKDYVKDVLSIMLSCGMYDFSGEWAYRVGLPAKSGVSGGIVAVVPGHGGIAVYSPPLDAKGNSVRGLRVFERLSTEFSLHFLESLFRTNTLGRAIERATA